MWTDVSTDKLGDGHDIDIKHIQSKNATVYNDEYIAYSLTSSGYLYCHRHYNFDTWDTLYSELQAPEHVIEEAKKIKLEQEKQVEKENMEREERRKHDLFIHLVCPRCGRELYLNLKHHFDSPRCGMCHTGKKATESTTVLFEKKGEVERCEIPEDAEIK